MTRNPYAITWLPAAPADLLALNAADEQLVDTALAALEDIAHHRQCGKLLSKRNVSGDLTGLYRLRFDVPGKRPQRFRIVYRLTPAERPTTVEVVALGQRRPRHLPRGSCPHSAAACCDDAVAFGRLVAPYRGELHAHRYRMLGSVQDAEDALQNALLGVWQGFLKFEGRSSLRSFSAWTDEFSVHTGSYLRGVLTARRSLKEEEPMNLPTVVSREEWLAARKDLLVKEKAATRARDALNTERRRLPMVRIEKDYVFDTPEGKRSLLDLFDGRRQLIVYHFMLDPSGDEGCPGCSLLVDNIGHLSHLHARNTSLTIVSRAPLVKIEAYRERMGWTVPWVSSHGSDFNYDFHTTIDPSVAPAEYNFAPVEHEGTGEVPGTSVFLRDGSEVFHTYSSYARGGDAQLGTYTYLDLTPLGRQEDWEQPPGRSDGPFMSWLRRHDEYDA